jgi:hypothetical protein
MIKGQVFYRDDKVRLGRKKRREESGVRKHEVRELKLLSYKNY